MQGVLWEKTVSKTVPWLLVFLKPGRLRLGRLAWRKGDTGPVLGGPIWGAELVGVCLAQGQPRLFGRSLEGQKMVRTRKSSLGLQHDGGSPPGRTMLRWTLGHGLQSPI